MTKEERCPCGRKGKEIKIIACKKCKRHLVFYYADEGG